MSLGKTIPPMDLVVKCKTWSEYRSLLHYWYGYDAATHGLVEAPTKTIEALRKRFPDFPY